MVIRLLNLWVMTQNKHVCLLLMAQHKTTVFTLCVVINLFQIVRQMSWLSFGSLLTKRFLSEIKTWFISHESLLYTFIPIQSPMCRLSCRLSFFLHGMFYVSERRQQASLSKAFPVIFLRWAYHYCNDKVRLYTLACCVYSVCACIFSLLETVSVCACLVWKESRPALYQTVKRCRW